MIKDFNLEDIVILKGQYSHGETVKAQKSSNALLLIIENDKGRDQSEIFSGIIPGKIFEYSASGTPILAIVPSSGFEADFIKITRTGLVCEPNNCEDIRKKIEILMSKEFNFSPCLDEINKFSRIILTKRLSDIFNAIVN